MCDRELVRGLLQHHQPRAIVHFAAESHVDRSILGPDDFIRTNVHGTFCLAGRSARVLAKDWKSRTERPSGFFMSQPTKCTDRWARMIRHFARPRPMLPTVPIPLPRRGRPSGARLSPHLRPSHSDYQLLQQLRSLPVSGETDSAHDPECARGQAFARLRRRTECRDWLFVEDHCDAVRSSSRQRQSRGDLQHRRTERETKHRNCGNRLLGSGRVLSGRSRSCLIES